MKKRFKLLLSISIILVLMLACTLPAFAYSSSCDHDDYYYNSWDDTYYCYDCGEYFTPGECEHDDSYCVGGNEYYCYDCNSYYYSYDYDYSYGSDDVEDALYIVLGCVVLTLLAPWIILGTIIFGFVIPGIAALIINIITVIALFIIGAAIFLLTPIIILVGAPVLFISLI